MKKLIVALGIVGVATTSVLAGMGISAKSDKELLKKARQFFKPLPKEMPAPKDNPTTKEKVELGKKLYYDPRLSLSGVISCNTCHNLATFGVDNLPSSLGHKFLTGGRNAPTTLNAGFHTAQFWDGRAKTLEDQAKGPILAHVEMAMPNPDFVVLKLKTIPGYLKEFKKAFPKDKDPITYDNVAKAIASFERTLTTPSRFDRFLRGDTKALTKKEKEGLRLFMEKGCAGCHNGVAVGGTMFTKFGIIKPYPTADLGKYKLTKKEQDKFVFKVPSLRNIAMTYPYFHDGQVWDLKKAVKIMGETQLGIKLTDKEADLIVAFLNSLTGDVSKEARTMPILPPSTPETPKPKAD